MQKSTEISETSGKPVIPTGRIRHKVKTKYPPCALQFHPEQPDLLVVGTYQLNKEKKSTEEGYRTGSFDTFRIHSEKEELELLERLELPTAVLDVKVSPKDPSIFLLGTSTGKLVTCRVEHNGKVSIVSEKQVQDASVLITSVHFVTEADSGLKIAFSCVDGSIGLVSDGGMENEEEPVMFERHGLEAWTVTSHHYKESENNQEVITLLSGGDDARLALTDVLADSLEEQSIADINRLHDGGIVAVLPGPKISPAVPQYELWTGGYDDKLKILDMEKVVKYGFPKPVVKVELDLGGGVWRLIPSPRNACNEAKHDEVLVCCMYNGAGVVRRDRTSGEVTVVAEVHDGHDSMVYGGDWNKSGDLIATCSFYDNSLQVWEAK